MRGRKAWLCFAALLALVFAQVPSAALAAMFSTEKCSMACCQPKPAAAEKKSEPAKCCEKKSAAILSLQSQTDKCGCTLMSAPTSHVPPAALTSNPSSQSFEAAAVLTQSHIEVPDISVFRAVSGIFGSDSGPPDSGSFCVWLGRAPPVSLA